MSIDIFSKEQEDKNKMLEKTFFERFGKNARVLFDGSQYYLTKKDGFKYGLGEFLALANRYIKYIIKDEELEIFETSE